MVTIEELKELRSQVNEITGLDKDEEESLMKLCASIGELIQREKAIKGVDEPCYCDKAGIGVPDTSCGDCPTRDYKAPPKSFAQTLASKCHEAPPPAGERATLIAGLLAYADRCEVFDDSVQISRAAELRQAAAMLEADAKEIQILQAEVDLYRAACDKRDAEFAKIKQQKPVAGMTRCSVEGAKSCTCGQGDDSQCTNMVDVFLAAGAQQVAVPQPPQSALVRAVEAHHGKKMGGAA